MRACELHGAKLPTTPCSNGLRTGSGPNVEEESGGIVRSCFYNGKPTSNRTLQWNLWYALYGFGWFQVWPLIVKVMSSQSLHRLLRWASNWSHFCTVSWSGCTTWCGPAHPAVHPSCPLVPSKSKGSGHVCNRLVVDTRDQFYWTVLTQSWSSKKHPGSHSQSYMSALHI